MEKLRHRIKELRNEGKMTQSHVANELNITQSTYSSYEIGRTIPSVEVLESIATLYDVTTDYLLGKTDLAISPSEMDFINDIDLENEELMKKYNLTIGDLEVTPEELTHFIAIIKINLKKGTDKN